MKNLKPLVFILSIFFFFSCESEQEIFEEEQEVSTKTEQNYQSKASTYIRSNKLKQINTTGYTATFNVDNSSEQITSLALLLEGSGGSLETVIKPSGEKDAEGLEIYNWDLDGDGIFEVGEEVKIIATPLNEDGKEIGGPQVLYLKVQADFTGRIKRVKIKRRRVGSGYKLNANITNNNNQAITATIKIDNLKGYTTTINTKIINNKIETSFESKNEKIFKLTFILKNVFGNVLGIYKEEIVASTNIIKKPTLKLNKDRKTYSLITPLKSKKSNDDYKNLKINVTLKATNGDNNGKGSNFGFLEITRGLVVYTDNNVNFSNSSSVIGEKFIAKVSLTNEKGEDLDYAEFRIVGLE